MANCALRLALCFVAFCCVVLRGIVMHAWGSGLGTRDCKPDDEGQPEVLLVSIAVLRSSDWLVQSAQAGPTDGVEVATARDHVAVATVPIANPYPPGSRDADIFDALTPTYVFGVGPSARDCSANIWRV